MWTTLKIPQLYFYLTSQHLLFTFICICVPVRVSAVSLKSSRVLTEHYFFSSSSLLLLTFISISCALVFCLRICLCGCQSHWNCELPCGCWDSNLGPLEKQPALLTSEPSLLPYCFLFKSRISLNYVAMAELELYM